MIWFLLDEQEEKDCLAIGYNRYKESRKQGLVDGQKYSRAGAWPDIVSSMGEYVVYKYYDLPYTGNFGTYKLPDIGERTQIRSTHSHENRLIIRPDDPLDQRYILTTGVGRVCIQGWIEASEIKDEWKDNPNRLGEAWFVPKEELMPMEELVKDEL